MCTLSKKRATTIFQVFNDVIVPEIIFVAFSFKTLEQKQHLQSFLFPKRPILTSKRSFF